MRECRLWLREKKIFNIFIDKNEWVSPRSYTRFFHFDCTRSIFCSSFIIFGTAGSQYSRRPNLINCCYFFSNVTFLLSIHKTGFYSIKHKRMNWKFFYWNFFFFIFTHTLSFHSIVMLCIVHDIKKREGPLKLLFQRKSKFLLLNGSGNFLSSLKKDLLLFILNWMWLWERINTFFVY